MYTPKKTPPFRKLRGYAFDPSLSLQMDTVEVNNITYQVEWETLEKIQLPGDSPSEVSCPQGEYLEIIDYDPATGVFYPPVNLDDPFLLAQDGLHPNVSSPQFHQQMVYAVIMTTIKNFERALGRRILWHDYISRSKTSKGKTITKSAFVRRLRVYPHALRQANAYYNPEKKSLLFGYFPSMAASPKLHLPGGTVFTVSAMILLHMKQLMQFSTDCTGAI
jgi:hypothetical protein